MSALVNAPVNQRFSGQVVLVAGGTGGLGSAVSIAFLEEGATVAVTYRSQQEFEALRSAAGSLASRLEGHAVDVTAEGPVRQLVAVIIAKHERLDAMTNAVGGYAAGQKLWETEPKVFQQMLSLNLFSGYVLARSVVPDDAEAGARRNCQRRLDGGNRSCGLRGCIRSVQGGGCGHDRFACRGSKGHRRPRELDSPEHHRYRSEPQSHT